MTAGFYYYYYYYYECITLVLVLLRVYIMLRSYTRIVIISGSGGSANRALRCVTQSLVPA
jgi:hypothetical protein